MHPALFFDRDGVLNPMVDRGEDCIVHGKKVRFTSPWRYEEFRLFDTVEDTLNKVRALGFPLFLVTNQPDIAYGLLPARELDRMMEDIKRLPFHDIFICPHGRNDGCLCKKPKPGMLLEAAKKHDVNLEKSFFVGDSDADTEAAKAVGCTPLLLDRPYNRHVSVEYRFNTLEEVIPFLEKRLLSSIF